MVAEPLLRTVTIVGNRLVHLCVAYAGPLTVDHGAGFALVAFAYRKWRALDHC